MKSKQPTLYEMMQEERDNMERDESEDTGLYPLPKILNARQRRLLRNDEHYVEH